MTQIQKKTPLAPLHRTPSSTAFRLALRHPPKFAPKPTPTNSNSEKLMGKFVNGWFEGMDSKQSNHKRLFFSSICRAEREKEGEAEEEFLRNSSSRKPMKMQSTPQD